MNSNFRNDEELLSDPQFLQLCDEFSRTRFNMSTKTFFMLLSQITRLPGIQWLGWYHTKMIWDKSTSDQVTVRQIVLNAIGSEDWRENLVLAYSQFFMNKYIPPPPRVYAFPVWDLDRGWQHEQWQSQVTQMTNEEYQAVCGGLSRRIYVRTVEYLWPEVIPKSLIDRIFVETRNSPQVVPNTIIADIQVNLACLANYFWPMRKGIAGMTNAVLKTGFHFCFPHFIFGLIPRPRESSWIYDEEKEWTETPIFFYQVETGDRGLKQYKPKSDWMVANSKRLPLIFSETISRSGKDDHCRLCHQAIALLKLIHFAINKTVTRGNPLVSAGNFLVKNMAIFTDLDGVYRYVFFFVYPNKDIKVHTRFFSFKSRSDMADLWLELWNARDSFTRQFEDNGNEQLMESIANVKSAHTSIPSLRGTKSRSPGVGRSASNSPSPLNPSHSLDYEHTSGPSNYSSNPSNPVNPSLNYMPAAGPSNYLQPPTDPYYSSSRRH